MEDKSLEDNIKGGFPVTNKGAETVEGVSSVDHSTPVKFGVLGSQNQPDSAGNSPNSGEKFGEKMEVMSEPDTGANEFLQNDQHPVKNNVFGSGEKQKMQDVAMKAGTLEETPIAFGKPTAKLIEEQATPSSGISGMKRKAETSVSTNNEESACFTPKVEGLQSKWHCSLCEVSTTSEGTLNHHMQGKKHKAKEAKSKSNGTTTTTSMDCDSSPLQHVDPVNCMRVLEEEQTPVANKWYCSICQVPTTSETLLKSHLQGKKHKAKEARLGLGQDKTPENVKTEALTKWYCPLCEVSAASENNLQEHFQGKKHKAKEEGKNPLEIEQKREENCENEQEMKGSVVENSSGEENQKLRGGIGKCWHCKMCNEVTYNEASMVAHRKGDKHREALRENGGTVIAVSTIIVKAKVEGESC